MAKKRCREEKPKTRECVPSRKRFTHAASLLAATLMLGGTIPSPVWADEISPEKSGVYNFDFAGGSLGEALSYIRQVSGLQYLYAGDAVAQIRVQPLSGTMTSREAVARLIAGVKLHAEFTDERTVIIKPVRPESTIEASEGEATEQYPFLQTPPLEEISVSSVRTTALGFKKISPTAVIENDILLRGPGVKLADTLYSLPFVTASRSAENTVYLSYGNGVNMLDLRAMGVVRTLVTVNGRRHVPTNGGEPDFIAVDTNMLPTELIDRVEILTSGASVLYGADAVAGLVNVILKKDFEGLQLSASSGISEKGDSETYQSSLTYGMSFAGGRGHYSAYASYQKDNGLKARDRFISREPAGFALGGLPASPDVGTLTRSFGYAEASESGTVTGYGNADGVFQNFTDQRWFAVSDDGTTVSDYLGLPSQRYNFASVADLISPSETFVLSGNLSYEFGDDHRFIFEHTFGRAKSRQEIAPSPIIVAGGQGIFFPIDNLSIPQTVRETAFAEGGDAVTGIYVNRRLSEVGNRRSDNRRDLLRLAAGLEGQLFDAWDYALFYQYGESKSVEKGQNGVDVSKVQATVSPEICAATAGCILTSYFGRNSITAEQADFIRTDFENTNRNRHHVLSLDMEGKLLELPAGTMALRTGLQYRQESLKDTPDLKIQQGLIAGNSSSTGAEGTQRAYEAYAAVSLPVLKDKPLAKAFTIDAGMRYSHFTSTGGTVSWQAGFEHRLVDGFDIRGAYQEARRSPNISELFTGSVGTRFHYVDPCNNGGTNTIVAANCAADHSLGGLSADYSQRSAFADGLYSGNSTLNEERAKTENLGFTVDSRLWGGSGAFVLAVDWFNIRVDDYIRPHSLQYVLNACYGSAGLDNAFCGVNPATGERFFSRDSETGDVVAPNLTLLNSGTFHASGLDIDLFWRTDLSGWGLQNSELQVRGLYSYNFQSEFISALDNNTEALRGHVSRPIHKLVLDTTYRHGNFTATWQVEHRSSALASPFFSDAVDRNRAPSVTYHNLSVDFGIGEKVKVRGGVLNLFGANPPFLAFSPANSFPEYYDTVGRRFYLGLSVRL